MPKSIPPWAVYAALFSLAWVVRFVYLMEMSNHPAFGMPLVDASEYHILAKAWAEGQRPLAKLSWQPWFYPLTLAQLYQVVGPSIWAAKLLQITVGSLTCVLTAALGFALWPRPRIRWIAGLTAVFYGPLIHYDGELLAEPWAALWIIAAVLLAIRYRQKPRNDLALGLGVLGALILFTRPPLIAGWLPVLLIAATAWWRDRTRAWHIILPHLGLLILGFGLMAWPYVHAVQSGTGTARILPVTGGINFYIGNSARPCETLNIRPGYAWENLTLWPELHGAHTDDEKDAFYREQAQRDIRANPGIFFRNLAAKTRQFFSAREIPRNIDIYTLRDESLLLRPLVWRTGGFGFPFGLLIGFAAIGFWVRRPGSFGLLLVIAGYAVAIIAVHVCDRYRLPVLPLFIVLASFGMLAMADAARNHQRKRMALFSGVLLLLGISVSAGGPFCAEKLNYRAELCRLIATTAFEQNNRPLATEYAQKAIDENPCEAQAWNQLGLIEAQGGNIDLAQEYFLRAVDCDPAIAPSWFNLGKVAAKQKQPERAIEYFRTGLIHAPAFLPAWIELGDLYLKNDQVKEAKECYEETLRIRPAFSPGRQRIAQVKRLRLDR